MKYLTLLLLYFVFFKTFCFSQKAIYENIIYLGQDGKSYTSHVNTRGNFSETYIYLEDNKSLKKEFFYLILKNLKSKNSKMDLTKLFLIVMVFRT